MTDKVVYEFEDMDVRVDDLKAAINGDAYLLDNAFLWDNTPQGYSYWDEQCFGDDLLQVEVLEDMLEQYKQWVNAKYDSYVEVGYEPDDDHENYKEWGELEPTESLKEAFVAYKEANTPDMVNNPSHYGKGSIECIDYIEDFLSEDEFVGYLRGNIAKYLHRFRYKSGKEDLLKAEWYLKRLIEVYE